MPQIHKKHLKFVTTDFILIGVSALFMYDSYQVVPHLNVYRLTRTLLGDKLLTFE